MENKNQTRTPADAAQQKPGFGSNSQSQANARAPQGSQTAGAQKSSSSQYDQSQKQGTSGMQKSTVNSSRTDENADKDRHEDESFKSSNKDSKKI
ncbi:MAG: hypothetical protein H7235_07975 [Bdellovibrionaceae bacterium]|nr:hypothetical protein [Pseudobdellovibrionaceae bacterium]